MGASTLQRSIDTHDRSHVGSSKWREGPAIDGAIRDLLRILVQDLLPKLIGPKGLPLPVAAVDVDAWFKRLGQEQARSVLADMHRIIFLDPLPTLFLLSSNRSSSDIYPQTKFPVSSRSLF
eukprot:1978160-Amphidinium_carterae.1